MTGIERYYAEQAEVEREAKKKTLAELRAGVTPILQEIEKLSWELEPALHIPWRTMRTYKPGEVIELPHYFTS